MIQSINQSITANNVIFHFTPSSLILIQNTFSRLNKDPPNIIFKKKEKGGINLQTMCTQTELDNDMVTTFNIGSG